MVVLYLGLTGGYEIWNDVGAITAAGCSNTFTLSCITLVVLDVASGQQVWSVWDRITHYGTRDRKLLLDSEPVSFVVALVIGATDAVIDYFVPDD